MKSSPRIISLTTKQQSNMDLLGGYHLQNEEIRFLSKILLYHQRKIQVTISSSMIKLIALTDIVLIRANSNYSQIHLKDDSILTTCKTLKFWCDMIDDDHFVRCHKSYCVNKCYVTAYDSQSVRLSLKKNKSVPVSRSMKSDILERIAW